MFVSSSVADIAAICLYSPADRRLQVPSGCHRHTSLAVANIVEGVDMGASFEAKGDAEWL
jgi:hypothetical protein